MCHGDPSALSYPTTPFHHLRPTSFDSTRHKFNSDKSDLTITSVKRDDNGEYICTAKNKIGESSATTFLDVSGMNRVLGIERMD